MEPGQAYRPLEEAPLLVGAPGLPLPDGASSMGLSNQRAEVSRERRKLSMVDATEIELVILRGEPPDEHRSFIEAGDAHHLRRLGEATAQGVPHALGSVAARRREQLV